MGFLRGIAVRGGLKEVTDHRRVVSPKCPITVEACLVFLFLSSSSSFFIYLFIFAVMPLETTYSWGRIASAVRVEQGKRE